MQPLALHKKCGKQMEELHFFFPYTKQKQTKKEKKKKEKNTVERWQEKETLHSRLVTEEYNVHLPN